VTAAVKEKQTSGQGRAVAWDGQTMGGAGLRTQVAAIQVGQLGGEGGRGGGDIGGCIARCSALKGRGGEHEWLLYVACSVAACLPRRVCSTLGCLAPIALLRAA
jgi:hypothetical protein